MSEKEHGSIGRRKVLKTIGSSGAIAAGFSTAASANEVTAAHNTEVYQEALEIREETDSVEQFRDHLRNNGAEVETSDTQLTISGKTGEPIAESSSDEFSTQKLYTGQLNLNLTYTTPYIPNSSTIQFDWSFTSDTALYGEADYDLVAIEWEHDNYNYVDMFHGTSYVQPTDKGESSGPTGIACDYFDNDHAATEMRDHLGEYDPTFRISSYIGASVQVESATPCSRRIWGRYWHTYENCGIYNISIGSGGVGVTVGCNSREWHENTNKFECEID